MVIGEGGRLRCRGKRSEAVGSPRDGGMVNNGAWSMSSEGSWESDGPGCYDVKLRNETATDASKNRFEIGKSDGCII